MTRRALALAAALALALALAACSEAPDPAREIVASYLLDPSSASFSDVTVMADAGDPKGPRLICGVVRGTSALGGPGQPAMFVYFPGSPEPPTFYEEHMDIMRPAGPTSLHAGVESLAPSPWRSACGPDSTLGAVVVQRPDWNKQKGPP